MATEAKTQGFIGYVEIEPNSGIRIIRITHYVVNGVANELEDEIYYRWILERCTQQSRDEGNWSSHTISSTWFTNLETGSEVYIDYNKSIGLSSKSNHYFPVNEEEVGYIYLRDTIFEHLYGELQDDLDDDALKENIERVKESQNNVRIIVDTENGESEEFVQLLNLKAYSRALRDTYLRLVERGGSRSGQNGVPEFLRDICYCDMSVFKDGEQEESDVVFSVQDSDIIGFVGEVLSNNRFKIKMYCTRRKKVMYDVTDEMVQAYFQGNRVPSALYCKGLLLEKHTGVCLTGIEQLRKHSDRIAGEKYYVESYNALFVEQPVSTDITSANPWFYHKQTNTLFKLAKEEAYGRVKLEPYDFQIIGDGFYIKVDKPNQKKFLDDQTLVLYQLFFDYYPQTKSLPDVSDGEKQILLDCIKTFLPDGCDKDSLVEHLNYKMQIERILGICDFDLLYKNEQEKKYKEIEEFYKKQRKGRGISDVSKRSNDLKNLLISIAQGFITVISGKPGNAKGALCDAIGECLGLTDLKMAGDTDVSRYREMRVSKTWTDKNVFATQYLTPESPYYEAFSLLDYEARNQESATKLPFIFALKKAATAGVDEYFEEFISICKNWYRKDIQSIGDNSFFIPKSLRFLMTINNQEGVFSEEFTASVNIIDIPEPKRLIEELQYLDVRKFYDTLKIDSFEPSISSVERWEDGNPFTEMCAGICRTLIEMLNAYAVCDGSRIVLEQNRIEHAVSRYWITAQGILSEEPDLSMEEIENRLIPEGVIVDEDCLISNGNKTIPGELVALDYALAQRVLPCVTKLRGDVRVHHLSELVEFLLHHKLYKCAANLKYAVDIGRVKVADELTDYANQEYIIKKCKKLYDMQMGSSPYVNLDKPELTEQLVDDICALVNRFRDKHAYTKNVVVNMLICLTQGFLTVFSGKPGCGKTSICRILGECLGLTEYSKESDMVTSEIAYPEFSDRRNEIVNPHRFLEVSTERGWTSKRDFIGYYNPLTEQFDKSNAVLYNAFLVLDSEMRSDDNQSANRPPCFILLDEANLSPMEYYWADFMNLCEEWRESNSIDLGGGKVFHIPETLHFMATINNDHTTEILSPRLIDRANVIDLPDAGYKKCSHTGEVLEIKSVSWEKLKQVFGCDGKDAVISEDVSVVYKRVKSYLEGTFSVSISPRTDIAVARYWTVAKALFDSEIYWVKADFAAELREKIEQSCPEYEQLEYISAAVFQAGESEKKLGVEELPEGYEERVVTPAVQALDYAVSQRVLPKLTDISGEQAFGDLITLLLKLLDAGLYKSAGIIVDMIQRGYDTGFYNYFR